MSRAASFAAPGFAVALGVLLPIVGACGTNSPASTSSSPVPPTSSVAPASSSAAPAPSASASAVASASAAPSASVAAAPDPLDSPKIFDDNGDPLPQTEDKPSIQSAAWQKRVALIFEAIQKDDPDIAAPAFFPKVAYAQVKGIPHPEADWKSRLMRNFARDIHEYHRQLKHPEKAELVGYKADEKFAKWMGYNAEGNKVGYFRITNTKLLYKNAEGKERSFDITSMISWRGEWFVVHLHGFK